MGPLLPLLRRTIPVFPERLLLSTAVVRGNMNLFTKYVFSVCLELYREQKQLVQVLTWLNLSLLSALLLYIAQTLFSAMCKLIGGNLYILPHPLE